MNCSKCGKVMEGASPVDLCRLCAGTELVELRKQRPGPSVEDLRAVMLFVVESVLCGKPLVICPFCESPTVVNESVDDPEHPELAEYHVGCETAGCPMGKAYRIGATIEGRGALQKMFDDAFVGDALVDKHLVALSPTADKGAPASPAADEKAPAAPEAEKSATSPAVEGAPVAGEGPAE